MLKPKLRRPSFGRRGRSGGGGLCVKCSFENTSFRVPRPCWYFVYLFYLFFLLGICVRLAQVAVPSPLCFVCHHINCHIVVFRPVDCRNVTPKEPNTRFLKQTKLLYLTSLFCLLNFIFNPISSLAPLPVELQDKHCVRISKSSVLQETLRPQAYATRSQRQVMTS